MNNRYIEEINIEDVDMNKERQFRNILIAATISVVAVSIVTFLSIKSNNERELKDARACYNVAKVMPNPTAAIAACRKGSR